MGESAESERGDGAESSDDGFDSLLRAAARASVAAPTGALLRPGSRICDGRFEIRQKLGEGGMGAVYEAHDAVRDEHVALKTMTRLDATSVYRMKNEFRALADVTHENLVRLHELVADGELWLYTMDRIDGVPFDAWVRPRGRLDLPRLRATLGQLCRGVAAIHEAGKLHRDLKPSNVLVTSEGRVVVLDFGLAADPELGGVGQTVAGEGVSGTPAYMAPEQAASQQASAASDWYAVGVMLFEALTGELPFSGTSAELLVAKQAGEAPDVAALAPGAPPDLCGLCQRLLSRDAAARPGRADLVAVLGQVEAPPASAPSGTPDERPELVGRDAELAGLRDAFTASVRGDKPVVMLLSGESGIGKSALLERFLAELRDRGEATLLSGRCYERERVPFKALDSAIDALSRHLRSLPRDEAAVLVPRDADALARLFPVLDRVAVISEAPERRSADPHDQRRRGFVALAELLGRMRDRRPLVLCIDDLQWGDADSMALLSRILRDADAPRLLCILSHRSEQREGHPLLEPLYEALPTDRRIDCRRVELGPLSEAPVTQLLSELPADSAEVVARESRGNPFLLAELGRFVREHGHQGARMSSVLAARIAALPERERHLLEVLSVAARPLPLAVAANAAGLGDPGHGAFDALRAAQLARRAGDGERVECYHDRIREVTARSLGHAELRRHHAALATALEAAGDADPERLALHLEAAGEAGRAAVMAAQAGDRAMAALAFDNAARLYEKALRLGEPAAEERHRLQVAHAEALANAGHGVRAAEAYLEALDAEAGEPRRLLQQKAAEQLLFAGRVDRGQELLTAALRPLGVRIPRSAAGRVALAQLERARRALGGRFRPRDDCPPEELRQLALFHSATAASGRTDPLLGHLLAIHYQRRAHRSGDRKAFARAVAGRMWGCSIGLEPAALAPSLDAEVDALLEQADDPPARFVQSLHLGAYLYMQGVDPVHALSHLERALAVPDSHPGETDSYNRSIVHVHRLNVFCMLRRYREVVREVPALLDEAWARNDLFAVPLLSGGPPALARIAAGDVEALARDFERARRAWAEPGNAYSYQDYFLGFVAPYLALYDDEPTSAWSACEDHWRRIRASLLGRSARVMNEFHLLRSSSLVALAARADGAERKRLARAARRALPRRLTIVGVPLLPPTAAVRLLSGDPEGAVETLRAQIAEAPEYDPRAPARRRLGVLLGGDEGRAMVAEADADMLACGVTDPERFTATMMPGLDPI